MRAQTRRLLERPEELGATQPGQLGEIIKRDVCGHEFSHMVDYAAKLPTREASLSKARTRLTFVRPVAFAPGRVLLKQSNPKQGKQALGIKTAFEAPAFQLSHELAKEVLDNRMPRADPIYQFARGGLSIKLLNCESVEIASAECEMREVDRPFGQPTILLSRRHDRETAEFDILHRLAAVMPPMHSFRAAEMKANDVVLEGGLDDPRWDTNKAINKDMDMPIDAP